MSVTVEINNGAYLCTYTDDSYQINAIRLKATDKLNSSAPVPDLSKIAKLSPYATVSLNMAFCDNKNVQEIDFTNWTHKQIIDLKHAFNNCRSLRRLKGFETLDLSSCNVYEGMCFNCRELREIDLSNTSIKTWGWDMVITNAFKDCSDLTTVMITDKTPRFAFPERTTIIDMSAGANRIFKEQISILQKALDDEKRRTAALEEELRAIRSRLETLM